MCWTLRHIHSAWKREHWKALGGPCGNCWPSAMHWSALDQLWGTGRAAAWAHAYQSLWMNHPLPCLPSSPKSAAPRAPQEMLKHSSISVSVGSLGPGVYKVCLTLLASLVGMGIDSNRQLGSGECSESEPKVFSWPNLYLHSDMHPPREPFSFNSYWSESESVSHSIVSDSSWPHGL